MNVHLLRQLPAVDAVLALPGLSALPRTLGLRATRRVLERCREEIREGSLDALPDMEAAVLAEARALSAVQIRRVINATGIVLHTNLGRAPLAPRAVEAVTDIASGYCNVEMDLDAGKRGDRLLGVRDCLRQLLGCEDAVVVNNNAAAVMLMLAAHAKDREVLVSRGELVEIGGSFRVPDVMALSGARLVEVGTTNRTRAEDFARATNDDTALILRVHPSNFRIEGFTEEASREELLEIGPPVFEDLGSGALIPFEGEPEIASVLRSGVTLASFSGDKLLGGSQAGLIVGQKAAVEACRRHPLYRALRLDKLALVALEATLRLYLEGGEREIPALSMLQDANEAAARRIFQHLEALGLAVSLEPDVGFSGGGALPGRELEGLVVRVECESPDLIARALRGQKPAILARVARSGLIIDPRCLLSGEEESLLEGLKVAFHPPTGQE